MATSHTYEMYTSPVDSGKNPERGFLGMCILLHLLKVGIDFIQVQYLSGMGHGNGLGWSGRGFIVLTIDNCIKFSMKKLCPLAHSVSWNGISLGYRKAHLDVAPEHPQRTVVGIRLVTRNPIFYLLEETDNSKN